MTSRIGFPLAHALNTFSMTGMMIVLSMLGRSELSIDVAIVQAATLVTFQALSGDIRSLILRVESGVSPAWVLRLRLILSIPLALAAWGLSSGLSPVVPGLAEVLILRRIAEWIAEIDLTEAEFYGNRTRAVRGIALQGLSNLLLVVALASGSDRFVHVSAVAWAAAPALGAMRFLVRTALQPIGHRPASFGLLLPHLGSTTIIAVSVYAFRSLIVVLAGKQTAGDLVAAYSVGGMIVSLFGMAAGPSRAFQQQQSFASGDGKRRASFGATLFVGSLVAAGLLLTAIPAIADLAATVMGKSAGFTQAVGASLIGGAVMLLAWSYRYRLLQNQGQDLFGPDVLSNLLILLAVPLSYRVLGVQGLRFSYLANGLICLAFYAAPWIRERIFQKFPLLDRRWPAICLAGLLIPVFIQLGSGLFVDPTPFYDGAGRFSSTPLPLSIAFCYLGLMFIGNLNSARLGLTCIFFTNVLIMLTTLVSSGGNIDVICSKTLLGLQFLLPMPAFVLGQLFANSGFTVLRFARIAFSVVSVLIPLQLVAMWHAGGWFLVPNVFLFSIYQQIQYVPVVMISLFLMGLFGLSEERGWSAATRWMAPIAGIYAAAAMSLVALGAFFMGMIGYGAMFIRKRGIRWPEARTVAISCGVAFGFLWISALKDGSVGDKYAFSANGGLPKSVSQRLPCWKYYAGRILNEPETWLAGHAQAPPRSLFPSAHNFTLDFMFNLGLLPLLPLAVLFGYLAMVTVRARTQIFANAGLTGLSVSVLFVVGIDNVLKVGLRQPYPGLIGYLLSGFLAAQLQKVIHAQHDSKSIVDEAVILEPRPEKSLSDKLLLSVSEAAPEKLLSEEVAASSPAA